MKRWNRVGLILMMWAIFALISAPHSDKTTALFAFSWVSMFVGGSLVVNEW